MSNPSGFYVYMYKNPLKCGEPFYVGKGSGKRCRKHIKEARNPNTLDTNLHKLRTIRQIFNAGLEPEVVIIDEAISEDQSFELEEFLISEIGRADLSAGPLTNMSNGGDGNFGRLGLRGSLNPMYGKPGSFTGKTHSKETKDRLAKINTGKRHSEETKKKLSIYFTGRRLSEEVKKRIVRPVDWKQNLSIAKNKSSYVITEEHKKKLSASLIGNKRSKGRVMSPEEVAMRSKALRGHIKPKTECKVCGVAIANHMLNRYHNDNCKVKK